MDRFQKRVNGIRIGYFADGVWGQNGLRRLVELPGVEIAFVCLRFEAPDLDLKQMAESWGIDVLIHPNVNADDFFEEMKSYHIDLLVSMSFNQIFKSRILEYPRYHAINCHAGKLPFYRGRNILNWALINDEQEFGITVHYIDTGIDTGDIIEQRTFPITDDDTYQTLLSTAHSECPELLASAVQKIIDGTVVRRSQRDIHPVGMYCGQRTLGDERLNWNQTSRQVFNFVRAICAPGPGARSFLQRRGQTFEVRIERVRMIPNAPVYTGIPGQVLYKTEDGFVVKTEDSFVEVTEHQTEPAIRVGDRLT